MFRNALPEGNLSAAETASGVAGALINQIANGTADYVAEHSGEERD